jgi:hypothetical protein
MKSSRCILLLCVLCVASAPLRFCQGEDEVDSAEVFRRGDSVEYVDGWNGSPSSLRQEIVGRHPDSEKFFISVLYRKSDGRLKGLQRDWLDSVPLLAFADPEDAGKSWAHLRFYDVDDASQNWRFDGIRVTGTPTILVQPCKSGAWGDPSTVILQTLYRGDPKALADKMAYALKLYATKLQERPRPRPEPLRHPSRRPTDWSPVRAQYSDATYLGDEPRESQPWNNPRVRPIEIPPLLRNDSYDDENGQCPGPNCPRPRPRPRPQPDEEDEDDARGPWGPKPRPVRPFNPFGPDDNDQEVPPRRPFWKPQSSSGLFELGLYAFAGLGVIFVGGFLAKIAFDRMLPPLPPHRPQPPMPPPAPAPAPPAPQPVAPQVVYQPPVYAPAPAPVVPTSLPAQPPVPTA